MNDLDHSRFETWQQQRQAIPQKREALLQLFSVFLRALLDLADRLLERNPPVEPDPPAAPARRAPGTGRPVAAPRPWTAEEDAILRRHPKMTAPELSLRLMGRSARSIACRRTRLRRHKLWGGAPRKPKQQPVRDTPEGEPPITAELAANARTVSVARHLITVIQLAVAKRLAARAAHRAAIRKRIRDFGSFTPPKDERRACMLHLLDLKLARRDEQERMEAAMRDA